VGRFHFLFTDKRDCKAAIIVKLNRRTIESLMKN